MRLLRFLTIEQWQAIDREYRKEEGFDPKALFTIALSGILLILAQYYGKTNTFYALFGNSFKELPFPGIYQHIYWAFANSMVYVVPPALVIKLVYREKIRDYGFHWPSNHKVHLLYLVMFLVVIPLVWLVSHSPSFLGTYPFYDGAGESWRQLLLWELVYGCQFLFLEFFFRGFMLFTLARNMGAYAIFAMAVPYSLIHFGKPIPETIGALIAGTALGTLALRTRSIYGGVIIHMTVAYSMDILAIMKKTGFPGKW